MTATLTAPPIEQVAPNLVTRIREGDLKVATLGFLGAGGLLLIGSCVGMFLEAQVATRFFFAYLVAFMFGLSLCLGGLFFTLIQHVTRAGWSVSVRRVSEHVMGVLPWMLLLFLPVVVGFGELYHWSHEDAVAADPVLQGKSGFLNPAFFFVRVGIYFAVWIGMAWWLRKTSIAQDESGDPALTLKMARVSAPCLLLFALSVTFAAFDWVMSLDPHWFSTIFGVTFFAGSFMAFLAFITLLCKWLSSRGYLKEAVNVEHYHDLGKLMFAFMVFWTYVNFSQYMLIWYANLPEETVWYQHRQHGGWDSVGTLLIVGHFFVPFAYLMSRHIKRNTLTLCIGAGFLLVMHWLDMQYLILPNMSHGAEAAAAAHAGEGGLFGHFWHGMGEWASHLSIFDFTTLLGMLSLITGLTLINVRKHNLIPTRDPRLVECLAFENQ